ncbi:DNA polymerase delta subunit 3 isoform X2 [Rhinoraja longicauda]
MVAMEELELLVENVEELVVDENRIVTYKMLSHAFGIHVNLAKQLLYYYVERKRKENSGAQLHVTYLVSGKAQEDGNSCHKVAVVREDQLEAVKLKMLVTASVHVYSIQKAMLKDSSPLFNTDYEAVKENLQNSSKYSAIRCADAVPRSAEEMARAHKSVQPTSRDPGETLGAGKAVVNGSAPAAPAKPAAPQLKGIMGMFAARPSAKASAKEERAEPAVAKDRESAAPSGRKAASKGNSFSNFFQKVSANTTEKAWPPSKAAKEEVPPSKPAPACPEKADVPEGGESHVPASQGAGDEEMALAGHAVAQKVPAKPPKEKTQAKKARDNRQQGDEQSNKKTKRGTAQPSDREEPCTKRRRRIRRPQSDSSDEDVIAESPETFDVKTPSPKGEAAAGEEEASPPSFSESAAKAARWQSAEGTEAGGAKIRKQHRVLKNKTFLNAEGEFVTEKVYQNESCTDSEGELTAKPQAHKPAEAKSTGGVKEERKGQKEKKSPASVRAGKQASIMGFFKKAT